MCNLVKSILAGIAIAFGGIAYLSVDDSIMGAFLFSLGLNMIYLFNWNLYTGKACYILDNKPSYLGQLGITFIGNLIGTVSMGYIIQLTKLSKLVPKAQYVAEAKLASNLPAAFILAIGCGMMMYVAVIGYKTVTSDVGKYLTLIMPIVVFTISGFEHVVANMFYFSVANVWDLSSFVFLIVVALGNMVGCMAFPLSDRLIKKLEK